MTQVHIALDCLARALVNMREESRTLALLVHAEQEAYRQMIIAQAARDASDNERTRNNESVMTVRYYRAKSALLARGYGA
jgi:hypothetical protein